MKLIKPFTILTCAWFLNSCTLSFGAVVLNGSFESGLASWDPSGNAVAQGPVSPGTPAVDPVDGSNHALISTGNDDVGDASVVVGTLETNLNLTAGTLSAIGGNAVRGSAISQALTSVNVGDVLTFSWNFLTNEATPSPTNNNDFSFFSLSRVGGASTATLLASTNSAFTTIANGSFAEQTGYQSAMFTFDVAGDYLLGFGAVNVRDRFGNSAVLIDQVSITAVPEPTSLFALGVGGLCLTMRRRRNR